MKINIVYFSQTGNTRKVAKAMETVFDRAGLRARTVPFSKVEVADFTDADVIGMGAPSFESQAPSPVREFLWRLPGLEGKKGFVFSTSGGAPGRVLYDQARPLMARGVEVMGGFLCRGTCFHPVPCLFGRFPERPDDRDLQNAGDFARAVLRHLEQGSGGPMPEGRPDALRHGFGFYHLLGAVLKDPLVRFLMPKPRADAKKCNQCRWCEKQCPTGSIRLGDKPGIAKSCIRCYRCLTGCPEGAFAVNWGISNFMVWTLYNVTFERWLGDVRPGERCY